MFISRWVNGSVHRQWNSTQLPKGNNTHYNVNTESQLWGSEDSACCASLRTIAQNLTFT